MKASALLLPHARILDAAYGEFTPPSGVEARFICHTQRSEIMGWSLVLDATVDPRWPRVMRFASPSVGDLSLSCDGLDIAARRVSSAQEACDLLAQAIES